MAAYITVGAKTTHSGTVITGSPYTTHNGVQVSRKGDKVLCKKCKKVTTILTGDPSFIVDGAPIARGGDITSCGAKLIAVQQSFCESDFEVGGIEQPEPRPRVEQPEPLVFPKSDPDALFASLKAGPGNQIEQYQPQPIRRDLTSGEIRMAESVFGDAINFGGKGEGNGVGIYDGKWKPFQPDNRAMAPNGHIYFPGTSYKEDFSNLGSKALSNADRRTFIHEMTHVWQHQHGKAVKTRGAALGVLSSVGNPYIYKLYISGDKTNLRDLSDYGLEQQAAIVGDYYAIHENLGLTPYYTNSKPPSLQDYEAVIGDNFKRSSPKVW
ncbi:PAAR domain-containing protein [uncultured Psychrobacter sp.]|uniref:PAAR domain-containing protein n=1 Tax=uncultured Psychrobacter sp. TaxID=259303 RepID=UPI003459D589